MVIIVIASLVSGCSAGVPLSDLTRGVQPLKADKPAKTDSASLVNTRVPDGYRAVCFDGTAFVAVGTGGRIDRIALDKTVTPFEKVSDVRLNGVISVNGSNIAVGNNGTILVSKNGGKFKSVKSGVKVSLNSITYFRNFFWIAGSQGILLSSADGEAWTPVQTGTKNDIRSISANEKICMAVTREGQIVISTDGQTWNVLDYNVVYKGYDVPYWFHSIRACGEVFFIAGENQENAGAPVILSSDTGEVWRSHVLNKVNDEPLEKSLPLTVNVLGVNWDQLIAVGNEGKLLTITECIECNKLDKLSDHNINDMAAADGMVAFVGDAFWFDVQESDTFRQYKILPEQARKDIREGAKIIDVRTKDEYDQSHIEGAVNIPVDQIAVSLTEMIPDPDTEIIFYCEKGVRAQKALEEAVRLGYTKVYNLGGLSDWPFEKASGGGGGPSASK